MWKISNFEIRGLSHIKNNIPCQDKTATKYKNRVFVAALADGAGSAKMSHFGANIVTKKVCEILTEKFDSIYADQNGVEIKNNILKLLISALEQEANVRNCDLKELASTLLCVATKNDKFLLFHLGDGLIVYRKNREILIASNPDNDEFANATYFITSSTACAKMRIIKGKIGEINAFALMSDGSAESFYLKKSKEIAVLAFEKIFDTAKKRSQNSMSNLLRNNFQNSVCKNTTDDCSFVVMVKK